MGNYHAQFLEGLGHGDMPSPTQLLLRLARN